jgi:hypothetical protein
MALLQASAQRGIFRVEVGGVLGEDRAAVNLGSVPRRSR